MNEAGEAFICTRFGVMQFYTGKGTHAQGPIASIEQRMEQVSWRILGWFLIAFASHPKAALELRGWVAEIEVQAR
jgi:hypothetical protein